MYHNLLIIYMLFCLLTQRGKVNVTIRSGGHIKSRIARSIREGKVTHFAHGKVCVTELGKAQVMGIMHTRWTPSSEEETYCWMAKGRFCCHTEKEVVLACTPNAEVIGIFWDHSDLHFLRPAHNAYKSMPTEGSKRTPNYFMSTI